MLIPTGEGEPKEVIRNVFNVIAWSPDGRSIIEVRYAGNGGGIWRVPLDGSEPVKLEFELPYGFRVHPDGRQIAFSVSQQSKPAEVWVLENFLPAVKPSK